MKKLSGAKHPILKTVGAQIVLSGIFVVLLIFGTGLYTHHGEARVVPLLKGKTVEEGARILKPADLRFEVVDSVYTDDVPPGCIVESIPFAGEKVKPDRIIFLTVNASGPKTGIIPDLGDQSARQAFASLSGIGFTDIRQKDVPGEYPGLTTGLELLDGRNLTSGMKVPLHTPIVLRVIAGGNFNAVDSIARREPADSVAEDTVMHGKQNKDNPNEDWW